MFTVGEAGRRAGLSPFQARWYADQGLVGPVARSGSRREFTEAQVELLTQIAEWRRAKLSLVDIRALLETNPATPTVGERVVVLVDELVERTQALRVLAEANAGKPPAQRRPGTAPASTPPRVLPPARAKGQAGSTPAATHRAAARNDAAS